MATPLARPQALRILDQLVGKKIERARLGIAPTLMIEAGSLMTATAGDQRFEWYLWIQHAAWRIEQEHRIVLASNDDRGENDPGATAVLRKLATLTIQSVGLSEPANDLLLVLSGNTVLRTFVDQRLEGSESCWDLFTPTNEILSLGTDGVLSMAPARK